MSATMSHSKNISKLIVKLLKSQKNLLNYYTNLVRFYLGNLNFQKHIPI